MSQTVKVLKKKAKGADKPAVARVRAIKEARKLYKAAAKAAAQSVPASTVYAGVERKQATVLAFKPASASVPVGGSLTFKNMSPSEIHNMVFIGTKTGEKATAEDFADTHQAQTDLFPIGPPGAPNQAMPDLIYGSEAPTTPPATWTYSGDDYGIGYLQTPVMDTAAASPPPGQESVAFTKAGTYHYYCAIHGKDMSGTVTVQ
jgi:plastocyanin